MQQEVKNIDGTSVEIAQVVKDMEVQISSQRNLDYNKNIEEVLFQGRDPNYQEKQISRKALLDKLPAMKFGENPDLEQAIKVSIDLSVRGIGDSGGDYFVSKTLKNFKEKKENQLTDDAIQMMTKKYELDEYSTNLPSNVFNPKKLMQEMREYEERQKILKYQQPRKSCPIGILLTRQKH